ncbi:MAG TPA: DUF6569 family protein [Candidatus Acidoferrales bacterium]|nr:DUF6569 family protein [Candidatus Acidoferrales bacterium]
MRLSNHRIRAGVCVLLLVAGALAVAALAGGAVIGTCACGDTTAAEQERVLYPVKTAAQSQEPRTGGKPVVPDWRALDGVSYENLTIFPVVARAEANTGAFVTLDEALSSGEAVVSESGGQIIRRSRDGRPLPSYGGPQVNQLVLINRGKRPLVLLAGEVVSGGKQDRVIAKDRIVPAGADPLPLDVFCVEHGRWTGASDQFSASKFMVHPSVREKAAVNQNQSEVWAAVRSGTTANTDTATIRGGRSGSGAGGGAGGGVAKAAPPVITPGTVSETITVEARSESYDKIYNKSRVGRSVDAFAEEISRRFEKATAGLKGERVIGVVVAYGDEVAWGDAFASEHFFRAYWPKLLKSYVVEALARPRWHERPTVDDARAFLEPLAGRVNEESEPGVYRWRQTSRGRFSEIELEALAPKNMLLHWVKIQKTS